MSLYIHVSMRLCTCICAFLCVFARVYADSGVCYVHDGMSIAPNALSIFSGRLWASSRGLPLPLVEAAEK